jgi:hypothetical protein
MRIYLDEDLASGLLAKLLQKAGHDVATPAGAGTLGRADAVQLACAIREHWRGVLAPAGVGEHGIGALGLAGNLGDPATPS